MSKYFVVANGVLVFIHISLVLRSSLATSDEISERLIYPDKQDGHHEKTPVLLLLIDSLRWDILEQYHSLANQDLLGFKLIKELGGHIERIAPVFPAECYPNLLSIVTGKYPDEHRLLFTTMFDEATNRSFTFDGRLHHSESDRVAASELWNSGLQGSKSFYFHFPLCGVEEPANPRCEPYAKHHMHPSALNRTLTRALKRLSDGTSDLVVVYYDQLDTVGHIAGPLSNELLLNVLPQLDQVLLDLVQQLRASSRDVHLVLTSDHGMTEVRGKELLDRFVSRNHVKKVINRGSTVGIWPHPNHYDLAYRRLEGLRKRHFAVYNRSTIPSSWRTGGPLFPPVLLVAEPGYLIHSDQWLIETNQYDLTRPFVGAHGYTATELDMHVPLFVFGPKVRPGVTYAGGPLDQVHTYRFLAALSGQSDTLQPIATSIAYGASIWSSHGIVLRSAIIMTSLGLLCFFCALMLVVLLWKVRRSRMPFYLIKDMDRNDDDMDERLISPDAVVKTTAGRDSVTA